MQLLAVDDRRSPTAFDVVENGQVIARVYRVDSGGWGRWQCEWVAEG